jgi:hypothetical protein
VRWFVALATVGTGALAIAAKLAERPEPPRIGSAPGPECSLPPRACTEDCDTLVEMPLAGPGYVDPRRAGEDTTATSTSYLRRDLMLAIEYAAAKVACKAASWNTGIGGPIVLGDASEIDGAIPGTQWQMPRHPQHSHVDGLAIDIAYYQRDTPDNRGRPVCPHRSHDGDERYHCLGPPALLDAWRTALFLGALLEEPRIRVIGIDGGAAGTILAAFATLCHDGWIDAAACRRRRRIGYEIHPGELGWYYGHHNHLHVAWTAER